MNKTKNWFPTWGSRWPLIPSLNHFSASGGSSMIPSQSLRGFWFWLSNMVVMAMFLLCSYLKIFNSIVFSIFVYMMNYFSFFKFSTDEFLHDMSMFLDIFSINPNMNITTGTNNPPAFPVRRLLAFASTRERAELSTFKFKWPNLEHLFAARTQQEQRGFGSVFFSHFSYCSTFTWIEPEPA